MSSRTPIGAHVLTDNFDAGVVIERRQRRGVVILTLKMDDGMFQFHPEAECLIIQEADNAKVSR